MGLGITPGISQVNDYWQNNKTRRYAPESNISAESPKAAGDGERIIGLAMLPYGNMSLYDTMESALQAAKEAQDLEYPLASEIARSPEVQQEIQKGKELYKIFIQKSEDLQGSQKHVQTKANAESEEPQEDYVQLLRDYMEKLFVKIQNGETEPKFQIGSQSFTIKEWEEFLEKFDEVEEAIRELQEQEIEKRKEEAKEGAKLHMLTSETLQARFSLPEKNEDGSPKEVLYLTAIDQNGIRCSKLGSDSYEWELAFANEAQYERANDFLKWANETMDNCPFAANQNFWEAFYQMNFQSIDRSSDYD